MRFKVEMLAFMEPGIIREVEVPDIEIKEVDTAEDLLNKIFYYGQNDFQPVPGRCSVSAGDVIYLTDPEGVSTGYHLVCCFGFKKVSEEWLKEYRKVPDRDRTFYAYKHSEELEGRI